MLMKNSISFAITFIVLNLFVAFTHAGVIENVPKSNPKGDVQPSSKPTADDPKNNARFAASLVDQDQARTHSKPPVKYPIQHVDGRYISSVPVPIHPFFANKWSFPFAQIFSKPQHPISIAPEHPVSPPVVSPPVVPQPVVPQPVVPPPVVSFPVVPYPVAPVSQSYPVKPVSYPTYIPQPVVTKPTQPLYPSKPATFVVSQQIIHKPILSERVEVIRRPVLTEVVQVVRKPVIREEVKVVKIPTYSEHVVKQPLVTHPVTNEITGAPIHLPSQQYVISDKPQVLAPVTTEVIQIPHQTSGSHGSFGLGDSSFSIQPGFKPSYSVSPDFVGGISSGYGIPSYSFGSGYEGVSTGYGVPSYNIGSSYGGVSSSYGTPSYSVGSGSEAVSGHGVAGSSTGSSYGGVYDIGIGGFGPNSGPIDFGTGYGVGPVYSGETGGVAHTFVEPYHGCKSGECKPTANEDSSNETPSPVPYPYSYSYYPPMWYGMPPSPYDIQSSHARAAVQDGSADVFPVGVQDAVVEPQVDKYTAFLSDSNVRAELANMFQQYVSRGVTSIKGAQERSNDGDVNMNATDAKSDDQKAKRIVNELETADPTTLHEVEEALKVMKSKVTVSDSKSTESTQTPAVSS